MVGSVGCSNRIKADGDVIIENGEIAVSTNYI